MGRLTAALARPVYSLLMRAVVAPLLPLRLKWRARAESLYGQSISQRYGFYDAALQLGDGPRLWLHAVSLGETRAAEPLLRELRALRPDLRLILTHGTATGREAGQALLRDGDVQLWLPIDTPGAVRRFLRRWQPWVGVLMETEVWPNLQHETTCAGVPMVLVNGRLSERSLAKSLRLDALMRPAAASLAEVLAQTTDDASRFSLAGAPHVRPVGNLKFDMSPDPGLLARGAGWRAALERHSPGRLVVLAASWREGEDADLIAAWRAWSEVRVGEGHLRPLLVVVPRHPQRFDEVAGLWQAAGFRVARRSVWGEGGPGEADVQADVWLGDSMREMPAYYALADVALLGGSFARLGGQNLIEAAACGCPVIAGPHTFNFAEAMVAAIEESAAIEVPDVSAALASIDVDRDRQTVASGQQRRTQASAFAAAHRGAAHRMARHVLDHLGG